jgi:cell division protein FtsI/penicillin-binding protein 2
MEKTLKKNTIILKIFFLFLAFLLLFQLFRVQILENQRWSLRSEIKNVLKSKYQAVRGGVYFSDGSPFAVSELAYAIYALPQSFKSNPIKERDISVESFAKDFAEMTGLDAGILASSIGTEKQYVSIAKKVRPEILNNLKEKYPAELNLWNAEEQYVRIYPNNELGSNIIGFVRSDDNGVDLGQYGVEQYFDGVLRGSEGIFEGKKDSSNNVIVSQDFESISSRNGIDITLTVDRGLQALIDAKAKEWNDIVKAKETTIVLMEPNTGRLLAVSNYPTFNPNRYWEGEVIDCNLEYYKILHKKCNEPKVEEKKEDEKKQEESQIIYPDGYLEKLKQLEAEQKKLDEEKTRLENSLKNPGQPITPVDPDALTAEEVEKLKKYNDFVRPIFRKNSLPESEVYRDGSNSLLYEPGSVVKPLTLSAAYNFNTVPRDPNFNLGNHKGCEEVIDATLCTATRKPVNGLTVEGMLQNSDNIGALRVAQTMPIKDFEQTYERYGLGAKTGVELADESEFTLKDPATWTKVDASTAAYGQGSVSFTPIQLTAAWNALASGGKYYKPTIVKEINDNGQIKKFDPIMEREVVTADAAKATLEVTAEATSKSGRKATEFYKKYPFAGKTGTANIPRTDGAGYVDKVVNMSYIGVAPAVNPRFTMLVWFREPRVGQDRAAPNSLNTGQWAWLDIAGQLMMKFSIEPKG